MLKLGTLVVSALAMVLLAANRPTPAPTTPNGYYVNAVAAEYLSNPQFISGGLSIRPPMRFAVTVTDMMGGPPTANYTLTLTMIDDPKTAVSDAMLLAASGNTDRSRFCTVPGYSSQELASTSGVIVSIAVTNPDQPSNPTGCTIWEGDYRYQVNVQDVNGKIGYAYGVVHVPVILSGLQDEF